MSLLVVDHYDHTLAYTHSFIPDQLTWELRLRDVGTINYRLGLKQKNSAGTDVLTLGHDFIGPYRTHFILRHVNTDSDWTNPAIGTNIMGGFHTSMGGAWGSDFMNVGGKDWLHYFERRVFPFDARSAHVNDYVIGTPPASLSFQIAAGAGASARPEQIAVTIINQVLSVTYSLPLASVGAHPSSSTGDPIDYALSLGDTTSLKAIVDGLAELQSTAALQGFDYWITPGRAFQYLVPTGYGDPATLVLNGEVVSGGYVFGDNHVSAVLDFTTNEFNIQYTIDELTFTNTGPGGTHVKAFGSGIGSNLGSTIGYVAGESTFWRLDDTVNYGSITSLSQLQELAQAKLSFDLNPIHEITLTIDATDGIIDYTALRPGMAIYLKLDLGWHQIDSPHQVTSMSYRQSDSGRELITLGLNQIYDISGLTGNPEG